MSCTPVTLSGIALDCGQVGGLSVIYIVDIADVTGVTVASGEVTSIAMDSGKKFKSFKFRKNNASFKTESTRNDENGTVFYQTVTEAKFNKMETAKRTEMSALAKGNTLVIAKDNNGLYWLIGNDSYNYGSVNGDSGSAMSDGNQYIITLTTDTAELPYQIADAFVTNGLSDILD